MIIYLVVYQSFIEVDCMILFMQIGSCEGCQNTSPLTVAGYPWQTTLVAHCTCSIVHCESLTTADNLWVAHE